jgi:hypothetical protein
LLITLRGIFWNILLTSLHSLRNLVCWRSMLGNYYRVE